MQRSIRHTTGLKRWSSAPRIADVSGLGKDRIGLRLCHTANRAEGRMALFALVSKFNFTRAAEAQILAQR
ncbi:hypothetical protein CGLO_09054 [Colletotrichum gloeosporioides Cg-14]|uniref:Uncharacterized protein n=1 Tax=Colletotrichum gloeosporioides (strain Cg-14) TaxID=1237896 RepID=T0KEL3_COLGC|nr:hypothetical protein CGLO_09054 [Colletotrichum gloeosporioides Cg-14]